MCLLYTVVMTYINLNHLSIKFINSNLSLSHKLTLRKPYFTVNVFFVFDSVVIGKVR